jgi:multiple sugar transport system permease protein
LKHLQGKKALEISGQALIWVILVFAFLISSVPFLFMITNSFEEFSYILPNPPRLLPTRLDFSAYSYIISRPDFPVAVKNSLINTFGTVGFAVLVSTLSAYGFARINFKGREALFRIYLLTLMVPGFLNIIPQFVVLKSLTVPGFPNGLVGTRPGLMLIYIATGVCGHTFFLRNFFRNLPDALSESALIDGGGHGIIFFRIMLPLSTPAIGTMSIFAIQGMWEEYFTAKVLVGAQESMITIPLLLQRLNGQHSTRWEWVFACSLMALLPIMILFIVFHKKLVVGGLTSGSVKE